jgi:chromosome segregation ATPase
MSTSLVNLLIEIEDLHSYERAESLLPQVKSELEHLQSLVRALDVEVLQANQALKTFKTENRSGILGKLFTSKEETQLQDKLDEVRSQREDLHATLVRLQDVMDYTPHSPLERDCILKELRLRKKGLQEQRREITQVAYGPRLRRTESVSLPAGVDPVAFERRRARYARESERLPGEDAETAPHRQLAQVEAALRWVEAVPETLAD